MKYTMMSLVAALSLSASAIAQTNTFTTNNPPTFNTAFKDLKAAFQSDSSNFIYAPYALYAPGLKSKWGGGLGVFYPVNTNDLSLLAGTRLDWVNGGFWMPSLNCTLQLAVHPFNWLTITPLGETGVGIPVSGAQVGGFTVPGQIRDNNGQPTAILGYGGALRIYMAGDRSWFIDAVATRERWTGFPGDQWRLGLALKIRPFWF